MADFKDKTFLIIVGQPKAGTTSLFDWMAQHPDVCPSNVKETRFFIDADYPLPRSNGYDGGNLELYKKNFDDLDRSVLLEATPDYLFCDLPLDIASLLPNARMVAILRDPVERITSAYYFYRQRGTIDRNWSLDDYVSACLAAEASDRPAPVHLRFLEQSRPLYAEKFRTAFGDRFMEIPFERLRSAPKEIANEVSRFAGLEPIDTIAFETSNKSRDVRFPAVSKIHHYVKPRVVYLLRRFGLSKIIPLLSAPNKILEKIILKDLDKKDKSAPAADMILGYLKEARDD